MNFPKTFEDFAKSPACYMLGVALFAFLLVIIFTFTANAGTKAEVPRIDGYSLDAPAVDAAANEKIAPLPPVHGDGSMLAQSIFTPAAPSVPDVSVYAPIPQPQAINPQDYFQQPSAQQVEEQRAGTAAAERNHYFISDCHKYNRACVNELQTLD